jgi:hypothetical protein
VPCQEFVVKNLYFINQLEGNRKIMIKCLKCNIELKDGMQFCEECGEKGVNISYCGECGNIIDSEFEFCGECGVSVIDESGNKAAFSNGSVFDTIKTYAKKINKKAAMIALSGVVCLAVIISLAGRDNNPGGADSGVNSNVRGERTENSNAASVEVVPLTAFDDRIVGDWVKLEYGPNRLGGDDILVSIYYFRFLSSGELWMITEDIAGYYPTEQAYSGFSFGKGRATLNNWTIRDNKVVIASTVTGYEHRFVFDSENYSLTEVEEEVILNEDEMSFEDWFITKAALEFFDPLIIMKITTPTQHSLTGTWESYTLRTGANGQEYKDGIAKEYRSDGTGSEIELSDPRVFNVAGISFGFNYTYDANTNRLVENISGAGIGDFIGGVIGGGLFGDAIGGLAEAAVESDSGSSREYIITIVGDYLIRSSVSSPATGSIMKRSDGTVSGSILNMNDAFSFVGDMFGGIYQGSFDNSLDSVGNNSNDSSNNSDRNNDDGGQQQSPVYVCPSCKRDTCAGRGMAGGCCALVHGCGNRIHCANSSCWGCIVHCPTH